MKKVMIAMSGGVDSSVAAHLLTSADYSLCGASLNLLGTPQTDAHAAADQLGIPFYE
ncbi:MAG: tRNA 2-thiouridine(34) synthase MnmA, partial [Clostridia bacterium]|nr:tRNA 2-thiouridine(34) synthase MnmA [Clostridia bacterium]